MRTCASEALLDMPSRDAVFMSSIIFGVAATHRRHGSRARAGWKPSVQRCFLCFLTTFGVMLLMEMLLLPSGMLRGLPGSSAAPVSVALRIHRAPSRVSRVISHRDVTRRRR